MRRILPLVLLAIVIALALGLQSFQHTRAGGYEAADFELPDLDGRVHKLSDYRGKIVFLNLWATWCPPCIAEMPSIEALHRRFASDELVVLTISADGGGAEVVRPFVERLGVTFPVLLDPDGKVSPRYGVTGYPETFIVGRDGRVIEHFIGPTDWVSQDRVNYFQTLLRRPNAAPQ